MDEDAWLNRHGLHPAGADLDEVRRLLREHIRRERRSQGDGDTALMKLCCVQLFHAGALGDVPLVWEAKTASFDADCSIDIQLLCGGGLDRTKRYLLSRRTTDGAADAALRRLLHCEQAEDFEDFTVERRSAWYTASYGS
ncbi:hypothetical protein ACFVQ4_34395 [Streptomyces laurentii]|uniref:hypothetical protein n=1 Tax=Streptomyces laurentii TaxID=39478 RepID=UPI0036AD7F03